VHTLHRSWAIALILFVPLVLDADEGAPPSPLEPLAALGKQLDEGTTAFLAGKAPAEAWSNWKVTEHELEKLRADLKQAGVTQGSCFGYELELLFVGKDAKPLYQLRTFVFLSEGKSLLLGLDGKPIEDKVHVAFHPLTAFTGPFEPIAKAAVGLHAAIRDQMELPLADAALVAKRVSSEAVHKDAKKMLDKAIATKAATCEAIRALAVEELQVRIDDVSLLVQDAAGTGLGVVRASFAAVDGRFEFGIGRFRAFPVPGAAK